VAVVFLQTALAQLDLVVRVAALLEIILVQVMEQQELQILVLAVAQQAQQVLLLVAAGGSGLIIVRYLKSAVGG
jgi:hypothetical protein